MKVLDPLESQLTLEETHLSLDFSNTANWHAREHPEESLNEYSDLIQWGRGVGLLDDAGAQALAEAAERDPARAKRGLEETVALREAIYHLFTTSTSGKTPDPSDVDRLNAALARAMSQAELFPADAGYAWQYTHAPDDLLWMLAPIARSAAALLTSDQLYRVGECADLHGCGWLFYDTSRNRSRRWCSMDSCGNRAKAQRHYQRASMA